MVTGENPVPSGCSGLRSLTPISHGFSLLGGACLGKQWGGGALSPFLGSALRCGSPWEDFHIHAAGRLGGTL